MELGIYSFGDVQRDGQTGQLGSTDEATRHLFEAIQLADRLFFLSDRPARVMLEKSLPPPRGARSREAIVSIGDEMRAWMAAGTGRA